MLAPRRTPPCFIESVAALNTFINEIGPEASFPVDSTSDPLPRSSENAIPVPPPAFCTNAIVVMALKMPSIESGTLRTKHAESIDNGRPAFTRHGVLGIKSRRASIP
jgi:hypothetical protein